MPAVGEVEQHTRNSFWGSGREEKGHKGDIGVGEDRAYRRVLFWPAGQETTVQSWSGGTGAVQLRFGEKGRGSAAPVWGRAGAAAWRKRSGSEAERGEGLRASGGRGFPVEAVLRGEAARGGEGHGSGGQEGALEGGGVGRVATEALQQHCKRQKTWCHAQGEDKVTVQV
jgi:hypothetical protein